MEIWRTELLNHKQFFMLVVGRTGMGKTWFVNDVLHTLQNNRIIVTENQEELMNLTEDCSKIYISQHISEVPSNIPFTHIVLFQQPKHATEYSIYKQWFSHFSTDFSHLPLELKYYEALIIDLEKETIYKRKRLD